MIIFKFMVNGCYRKEICNFQQWNAIDITLMDAIS